MFDYNDLKSAVGDQIGYGVGDWTPDQEREIDLIVKRAYTQYLYPPPIDGVGVHTWNFLRPKFSLTTDDGVQDYDLPRGFVRFTGDLTYSDPDTGWVRINFVSEGEIRALRMRTAATISDYPTHAAVRAKAHDGSKSGSSWELMLWPTPGAGYVLDSMTVLSPHALTDDLPIPVGTDGHIDLLMQSCLAIAEQNTEETPGIHTQKFMERLSAMIMADAKTAPQSLGYNGNGREPDLDLFRSNRATYAGVMYD